MAALSEIILGGINILVSQTTDVPVGTVKGGLASGIIVAVYSGAGYSVNDLVAYTATAVGKQVLIDSDYCLLIKETDIELKYTPTIEI